MMTTRKKAFIEERAKDKLASGAEIARRAGYSPKIAKQQAYALAHKDDEIKQRIEELGEVGLDTLEDVAKNGRVEVARVQAGKALVEQAYGNNPSGGKTGNITINISKLEDLKQLQSNT